VEDLEKGINDEIATVLKNGVTPAELAKAKRVQLIQFIERRRSALRTAVLIGDYAVYFNDPNLINTIQEKRNAITVDQVNAVIKTYLLADQRTVVITYPAADANAGSKGAQ
jgi:predicted Zn-dependent peptidase